MFQLKEEYEECIKFQNQLKSLYSEEKLNIANELSDRRVRYFLSKQNLKSLEALKDPAKSLLYLYLLHNVDYPYGIATKFRKAEVSGGWKVKRKIGKSVYRTDYLTRQNKVSEILKEMIDDGIVEKDHIQKSKNNRDRIYYKVTIEPLINALLYYGILKSMNDSLIDFGTVIELLDKVVCFVNKCSKPPEDCIKFFNDNRPNGKNAVITYVADLLMAIQLTQSHSMNPETVLPSYKGLLDYEKVVEYPDKDSYFNLDFHMEPIYKDEIIQSYSPWVRPDLTEMARYLFLSGVYGNISIYDKPCLFCWDEIPGNGSLRIIEFLSQRFDIDWIEKAKIEKIDNDKTIRITNEKNYLSLKLNNEKTKMNLEINNDRVDEFIVKNKTGRLNIYDKSTRCCRIGVKATVILSLNLD